MNYNIINEEHWFLRKLGPDPSWMWNGRFPAECPHSPLCSHVLKSTEMSWKATVHIRFPLQLWRLLIIKRYAGASLVAHIVKSPPAMWETQVWSLGREDPLGKRMATHSSILAWRKPRTEEPGGLQSTGLQGVKHYRATNTFFSSWKEETECETMGKASWRVYPRLLRCTHTERIWSQVSGLLSGTESPKCSGRVFKSTFALNSNSNWFHSLPVPHTGCKLLQSCLTLCNSMDCSPPGSSVYGIF